MTWEAVLETVLSARDRLGDAGAVLDGALRFKGEGRRRAAAVTMPKGTYEQ
ncbi:hypothetical protein ACWD4J_35395 [Streptomyces sp. NPDC002577]